MLTAGNVQFQPPATKIYALTTSIALMVAGDMAVQAEIIAGLKRHIQTLLSAEPKPDWFNVSDVAGWYSFYYEVIKSQRAEKDYLLPLGLTKETYISRQQELSPELVNRIATELINFSIPSTAAIVAGIDRMGPHLYAIINGDITCQDAVGFAAIGAGAYHASSYFMFAGHARNSTLSKTFLTTYASKKRAEVAPGVGVETDMFIVGPELGTFSNVYPHVTKEFEKIYINTVKGHSKVDTKAEGNAHEFIEKIIRETIAKSEQTAPKVNDGASSADEEYSNAPK